MGHNHFHRIDYIAIQRRWVNGITMADPLADAVVADFAGLRRGQGMEMFRSAVESGIDTIADVSTTSGVM